jgi:hypothetical protein
VTLDSTFLSTTASSSSSSNRLYLDQEAILNSKPNSRIVRIDKDDDRNRKGVTFLAFCNNDQRILNKGCIIVCLYNSAWHRVHHDSKGKAYLGIPQPNVHFYDEDIRLPVESNADTDNEAPTQKLRSDPPSEEEIQEPLLEDFSIRYALIDPSLLTPSTQPPVAQRSDLPEEPLSTPPDPLWNHP